MCDSSQPQHGADSPEARSPYRVLLEDRWEPGERIEVRVDAAYGPRDAVNQALLDHPGWVAIQVAEVVT